MNTIFGGGGVAFNSQQVRDLTKRFDELEALVESSGGGGGGGGTDPQTAVNTTDIAFNAANIA